MNKYKVFIACDSTDISKINEIIEKTKNTKFKIGYKFGLEFFNSKYGRKFVSKLNNEIIFADLKLHDIPNTCVSTIRALEDLKVNYLTIHISSGFEALKAAKKVCGKTKLIGVTILTSLDNKLLKQIGYDKNIMNVTKKQVMLAKKANLDAVVCSPKEVKIVRKIFKKEIITPGIRLNNYINDQKRVLTPKEAFENGSDWIVIGRPITKGNISKNLNNLIYNLE
tara:strand:+ start:857 stop:1528 length:672 start_codon:yes stop_codon:yes gene_type:complete